MMFKIKEEYFKHNQNIFEKEIGHINNINFIKEKLLCNGCATCDAICPNDAITMLYDDKVGVYEPVIDSNKCENCQLCVIVCPGFQFDLQELMKASKNLNFNKYIGPYKNIWRAYSKDNKIRQNASSGGIITQTLKFLLESGKVDGAIITRMDKNNPLETDTYIAWKVEDLFASQKSHYTPTPLNSILKPIIRDKYINKRFAYVGLPSHVQGLRKIQRLVPDMVDKIPYVFSLFTAHIPTRKLTEFILYKENISVQDVKKIEYRGGGNPGRMRILLKTGEEKFVPHLKWYYFEHAFPIFFFSPSEWLYFDKLSQWADCSMGDNWQNGLAEQNGASTVITRNDTVDELLREMIDKGIIKAFPMTTDDLITDQKLKSRLNIGIRHKVWNLLGNNVPSIYPELSIKWNSLVRTLRWALYIKWLYRPISFFWLDKIIKIDYVVRKKIYGTIFKLIRYLVLILKGIIPLKNDFPTRSKKYKVLILGRYEEKQIADELIAYLKNELSNDLEIVLLAPNPLTTIETYTERSIKNIRRINLTSKFLVFGHILTSIVVNGIIVGALCQRYGIRLRLWTTGRHLLDELVTSDVIFNIADNNSTTRNKLIRQCTIYLAAKLLNKKVILSGKIIGPYNGWFDKFYTKLALNTVHLITLCDKKFSQQQLIDIGVNKPIIRSTVNDAYVLPAISIQEAKEILAQETGITSISEVFLVFMNLNGSLKLCKEENNEVVTLAKIADKLVTEFNATVILLPTNYNIGDDDRDIHSDIVNLVNNKENIYTLTKEYNTTQLKGIIGLGSMTIGVRYNFNMFAASVNIPFFGLASGEYQLEKLRGLIDIYGISQYFIEDNIKYISIEQIWPKIIYFIKSKENIKKQLLIINNKSLKNRDIAINELIFLLKNKDY
ncbi:MAG: Coenzyme F420 hydrogenase/dehydrogenase, beta subunit C-terminal domain [Candidatus Marithrix sp.]